MKLPERFLLMMLAITTATVAEAQHQTFALNPGTSEVKITLKTNHEIVNGSFHVQSGNIEFDASSPALSGGVSVDAGSGKTGNDSRDKKMDKDVLVVQKYATVTFAPKSYTGTLAATGDSTIQVSGVLTLLGTPHDITIPMQVHIEGGSCTVKGHFVVPYVQWGLKDPSFLMWKAEKQVDVDLNLVGHVS